MDNDRKMVVTDENGKEVEMYILFTTNLPENDKKYVFYINPADQTGQVYVSSFTEEGRLFPVEDEAEWQQLEEVFNSFIEDSKSSNCQNCDNNCEDCESECDSCNK